MIKVNLVPADILAKARQRQLMLQGAVVAGGLVVMLAAISLVHWYGIYSLRSHLSYQEAELRRLDAIVKQVEELEKAANAVRARLGVIEDLLRGRSYYPVFMSDFARGVPPGVRVVSMNTAGAGPGAIKLTITAFGNSNDDVAAFARRLEENPKFTAVELGAVSASGTGFNFGITTTYTSK
jgi:Tfp pilus assembly protein PilN